MSRAGSLPRSAAGFTLLELLVVLAIVAGVVALVPFISERGARRAELDAVARVLAADLRWLKHVAVRDRHETSLDVDTLKREYRRSVDAESHRLPDGIDVAHKALATFGPDKAPTAIAFYPDGTSSGGRVDLKSGQRSVGIIVTWPFGRIEMQK